MSNQLKQRLVMSTLGVAGVIIAIYFSYTPIFQPLFVLLNAGIVGLALSEYYQLAQHKGFQPLTGLAINMSVLYVISAYLSSINPLQLQHLPSLVLLGSLLTFFLGFFRQEKNPLVNLSITTFGLAYLTIPLTCVLLINYFPFSPNLEQGRLWLGYVLVVTKATDMGAYIVGKTLGRTPLAAHISPKKTIEGSIGGMIASLAASLAFYFFVFHESGTLTLVQSIVIGIIMSILAQLGDLAESVLKRDAGVKDSSRLPGLGGMLDIVDSLVFTLPLMYLLLQMKIVG